MYYHIIKVTRSYHGTMTITKEEYVNIRATRSDVDKILSLPEHYAGEREEAIADLETTGITGYHGYRISEC